MDNSAYILLEVLISLIYSFVCGFATAAVRERKGYGRNWFWLGLSLGVVPFIIACAIPARHYPGTEEDPYRYKIDSPGEPEQSLFADDSYVQQTVAAGGWQCSCGRANPAYVSTCTCGLNKRQNDNSETAHAARVAARAEQRRAAESELRKYKVMLDSQLISVEEYNAKVRELRRYL